MPCDEPILTMRVLASGAYSVSMTGQSASRLRAAAAATGIREVRAEPTIGAAGDVMPIRCHQPSSSIVQSQCLTALATVSSARLRTRRPRPWRCSPARDHLFPRLRAIGREPPHREDPARCRRQFLPVARSVQGHIFVRDEPGRLGPDLVQRAPNATTLSAQRVCSLSVSRTFHRDRISNDRAKYTVR
jgi:hypothetical protein